MTRGDDIKITNDANPVRESFESRNLQRTMSRRCLALFGLLVFIVLLCMCLPSNMFGNPLYFESAQTILFQVYTHLGNLLSYVTGGDSGGYENWICLYICGAVGGAALGMCGSVYQGALRNPLAAPKTLGVMSGGALGVLVYVLFIESHLPTIPYSGYISTDTIAAWMASLDPFTWFMANYGKCLCSIIGCFLIVGVVIGISALVGRGRLSNITMIIAGQIFAASITALILYFKAVFISNGLDTVSEELAAIENYCMQGSYNTYSLAIICVPLLACMLLAFCLRGRLTALSLGDEEAQSMGVNVNRLRYGMVALCTLMTAISISFNGHVAFLGFISAHLARRIVGPDMRFLLPASAFVGGMMFTVVYYLSRSGLPFTAEGSAGVICGVVGSVLFLVLVIRHRGDSFSSWGR